MFFVFYLYVECVVSRLLIIFAVVCCAKITDSYSAILDVGFMFDLSLVCFLNQM